MTSNEPWIETFSGGRFYPLSPRAEDVRLVDISHALAMKCRFAGHCHYYYSVAQHCVLGAEQAERDGDLDLARAFLLHDAAEAYLFDCPKPIKHLVQFHDPLPFHTPTTKMKDAEANIVEECIRALWPEAVLDKKDISDIKLLDARMLATEARDLMPSRGEGWGCLYGVEPFTTLGCDSILDNCWYPQVAELEFLRAARRLGLRESA